MADDAMAAMYANISLRLLMASFQRLGVMNAGLAPREAAMDKAEVIAVGSELLGSTAPSSTRTRCISPSGSRRLGIELRSKSVVGDSAAKLPSICAARSSAPISSS